MDSPNVFRSSLSFAASLDDATNPSESWIRGSCQAMGDPPGPASAPSYPPAARARHAAAPSAGRDGGIGPVHSYKQC